MVFLGGEAVPAVFEHGEELVEAHVLDEFLLAAGDVGEGGVAACGAQADGETGEDPEERAVHGLALGEVEGELARSLIEQERGGILEEAGVLERATSDDAEVDLASFVAHPE